MNRPTRFLFLCLTLALSTTGSANDRIVLDPARLSGLGIRLGPIETAADIPVLTAPATVVVPPDNDYIINSSLGGLIIKLQASAGDRVEPGEPIAIIDSPELLSLQQRFLDAKNLKNLATAEYRRARKLHQEGIISDRRWQESGVRFNSANSEYTETRQMLQISGISNAEIRQLEKTSRLNGRLTLRSPIQGVVLDRTGVLGSRINANHGLYRIADLRTLWLELRIPADKAAGIKPGDRVTIPGTTINARISVLGEYVDPRNQTILARAVIDTPASSLRVGQSINTRIVQTRNPAVFDVPQSSLVKRNGKPYVFVRTADGFSATPVQIEGKNGNRTFISGTLHTGQQIAVAGTAALKALLVEINGAEE